MKKYLVIFIVPVLILLSNCNKNKSRLPIITTSTVTPYFASALCAGVIYVEGDDKILEKGFLWGTSSDVSLYDGKLACGNGSGSFTGEVPGLSGFTNYFVRAYAINRFGISYGKAVNFRTQNPSLPAITLGNAFNILTNTAECQLSVSNQYLSNVTSLGVCWATHSSPGTNDSKVILAAGSSTYPIAMNFLFGNTTYYARAFVSSSIGVVYSNEISFKTVLETVTDIDGNVYPTVKIGSQVWMAANLRVSRYADGSNIPVVAPQSIWGTIATGACCSYNNFISNDVQYGKYYNWFAVNDPRQLAPNGWRVPDENDWSNLVFYLGNDVANKLRYGTASSVGFNAEMGGYRDQYGIFNNFELTSSFWTSTEDNFSDAIVYSIIPPINAVNNGPVKKVHGCVIRCIKN